jgi:hypothetical protein
LRKLKGNRSAYKEGESKLRGTGKSVPPLQAIKTPLRDGELEDQMMRLIRMLLYKCKSAAAPGIVDAACQPIMEDQSL